MGKQKEIPVGKTSGPAVARKTETDAVGRCQISPVELIYGDAGTEVYRARFGSISGPSLLNTTGSRPLTTGKQTCCHGNEFTPNNRGTAGGSVFYAVRAEVLYNEDISRDWA
jgi:hypothetical protein